MAKVDYANIKNQVKAILEAANTSTATPLDLSNGLRDRPLLISMRHPAKVMADAPELPAVCMYYDQEDNVVETFAKDLSNANIRNDIELRIVSIVSFIDIGSTDVESDSECETLNSNVKEILRNNFTLNDAVKFSVPLRTTFFEDISEENIIRAAEFTLKCTVYN